jgi:hypothetical protein
MAQLFVTVITAAMVASIILITARPVRSLAIIQIGLTALVVIAFFIDVKLVLGDPYWAETDPFGPGVQEVESQINFNVTLPSLGTAIPWLFFTIFHVIFVLKRKRSA